MMFASFSLPDSIDLIRIIFDSSLVNGWVIGG